MLTATGKRPGETVGGVPTFPERTGKIPKTDLKEDNAIMPLKGGSSTNIDCSRWWTQIGIGGFRLRALCDSGAARTAIGPIGLQIASACGQSIIPYKGPGAKLADGTLVPIYGYVELPFNLLGQRRHLKVMIMSQLDSDCILGTDFMRAFNAILLPRENRLKIEGVPDSVPLELSTLTKGVANALAAIGLADITPTQRSRLEEVLNRWLPEGEVTLGCTSLIQHAIEVGSARPIKQRYYPVSRKLEEEMHAQVLKMLDAGIIRRSNSEWSSPVVMVRKSDGAYRFCIDYRKLNSVSKASAYPLPYMDAILNKLQHACYISTIDLSAAYHQIPMKEGDRHLTAFTVPGLGLFEFTRMPYGVVGGPATFQQLSDKIIGPGMEPHAFSYLDDIIITTDSFEEHLHWLEVVLKRIKEAGLTINREKSKLL